MSLLAKASDSVNSFCLKLYAKLTENSQESKVFFSPASISVALAMIYAGTNGNTAREVEQLLNWNTPETVHEMMQNLQESILSSSGIELHLANRLWAQQEFAILKQYTDLLKSRYQTEMSTADFQGKSEEARKDINQWVEEKTNAKIKDILGPGVLNPHTKLVLVNAVYFKGLWEEVFLKEHSMDWNFKINTSNTCKVTLMNKTAQFMYARSEYLACQVLKLKYKQSDLAMMIFLPDEVNGLPNLEKKLNVDQLKRCNAMLSSTKLRVSIPTFTTDCKFKLKQLLAELGVLSLFSSQDANLSGVTGNKSLFVTEAIHQAFVDVNEQGTEAAAATAIIMAPTCIMLPTPHFLADHPFLFFIQHGQSGAILFAGKIVRPENK